MKKRRKSSMMISKWMVAFQLSANELLSLAICRTLLVFICCSLLFSFNSSAQKVTATVDREKILIGEQIELKISVTDVDRNKADIAQWCNLPDSFNHVEVVKRLPIDTVNIEGIFSYSQKIILTSFDSGYWQIPEMNILFENKQTIKSTAIGISVLPVDVSNLKDYHDIKEIIDVKAETDWLTIFAIIIASVIFIILLFLLIKYLKKRKPKLKTVKKQFGIKEVLEQIDALQQRGLIEKKQHKMFFTELIEICRSFSDQQLNISTANKTTDEYMLSLKGKVGSETSQIQYFQLLRLGDAVKFAKFIPSDNECDETVASARVFLQTIYEYQFQKKS